MTVVGFGWMWLDVVGCGWTAPPSDTYNSCTLNLCVFDRNWMLYMWWTDLTYVPLCQSSVTVQSLSENATTPVSLPSSVLNQTPPRPRTDKPGLSVAAQMEPCGGSHGTLGSMIGGLQGGAESPLPGQRRSSSGHKPDLLPGSNHHMWPAQLPWEHQSTWDRLVCSR